MIRTVEYRNFKALRHVKLDLERFTVLVGPNASGKTSILEGLSFATHPSLIQLFLQDDPIPLYTRGQEAPLEILLETVEVNRKIRLSPPGSPYDHLGGTTFSSGWRYQVYSSTDGDGQWRIDSGIPPIVSSSFLRLNPTQLAKPSFSQEQQPRLDSDGQGLASALVYLLINRRMDFDRLLELTRLVCPYVEAIRFNRKLQKADQQMGWGEELVLDLQGAPDIPARMVSDGTLIVLGLLTVIMGPDNPKLILLDDLDHGLHPRAQRDLVTLFRKLFEQDPELQIVATTHSPYLLDQLDPKEVRLTTRLEDGSVACARLDEHPDFEKWKEAMTPGEFWSMVGEKWVGERQWEATGS